MLREECTEYDGFGKVSMAFPIILYKKVGWLWIIFYLHDSVCSAYYKLVYGQIQNNILYPQCNYDRLGITRRPWALLPWS